jgi:hypothetical protein
MSKTDYFNQCSIYDFLGMKVVERDIKPNQQRFMVPLQGLPKGVYIINLKNKKGVLPVVKKSSKHIDENNCYSIFLIYVLLSRICNLNDEHEKHNSDWRRNYG